MFNKEHLEVLESIDMLNALDLIYTEEEEEELHSTVIPLTGCEPCLWKHKIGNRQQCYSNMYSKLLVSFLLKKGEETGFLSEQYLKRIAGRTVDTFEYFMYDDMGYDTSHVLEGIFDEVLLSGNIFQKEI